MTKEQMIVSLELTALALKLGGYPNAAIAAERTKEILLKEIELKKLKEEEGKR